MVSTDSVRTPPEQAPKDDLSEEWLAAPFPTTDLVDTPFECSHCSYRFADPVDKEHHEFQCSNTGEHALSDSVTQSVDRSLKYVGGGSRDL